MNPIIGLSFHEQRLSAAAFDQNLALKALLPKATAGWLKSFKLDVLITAFELDR